MDQGMASRPQPRRDSPAWVDPASNLNMFDFPPAPSASVNAFDPAVAAFADMSFSRPEPAFGQPSDSHDKKRLKVETDTPTLDSIDYWAQFDNDPEKMGSFEIDYTQRQDNR